MLPLGPPLSPVSANVGQAEAELRTLEETGRHVLCELAKAVGVVRGTAIAEDEPGREGVPTVEEPARWRRRYPKPARSTAAEEPDDSRR